MSLEACAALVERADPVRFRATMASPVAARRVLFALYAFNVEVARAPWVTKEPMIAEMRLQWWRDALDEIAEGRTVRRHDIVDGLAAVLDPVGARCLDGLVAARRWDCYTDAFEDQSHFDSYLDATSGNLMWTCARLLGDADETIVRHFAFATGVANMLLAVPQLEERGRKPLVDGTLAGVMQLAQRARVSLAQASTGREAVGPASGPALLAGYGAAPILRRACNNPGEVAAGQLGLTPLAERLRLTRVALTGWWR
jgi:hypothetical protein